MKTMTERVAFGTATFTPIRSVHYVPDEDGFEVVFDSGAVCMLDRRELLTANGLPPMSKDVVSIWLEAETRAAFTVRFGDGVEAEASWERVLERPPATGFESTTPENR